jgi:hypothetical protein
LINERSSVFRRPGGVVCSHSIEIETNAYRHSAWIALHQRKGLQFDADDGALRLANASDPVRKAILLVAVDKSGTSSACFYKTLITEANTRFAGHLDALKNRTKK